MVSVIKEVEIAASPAEVWAVYSDFAEGPQRMAPGYVTGTRLESDDIRVVSFANGQVARERLIAIDHEARRMVWEWNDGWARPTHDNASMQVFANGDKHSRVVWIHDVLPDSLAEPLAQAMEGGLAVMKESIEDR
ncbi:MAG TPA: SRPBCC family protein [Stackebrandtia sp.]|uniref:SRPBCC family protein n=1 Tax=Stackebrandtia sp. TaxID=2023065 RepID=UPI002D73E36B|nr:SRPBCC family protein [Stackebrandtia sp.]HZE38475.1 SRPBCC family protein [Stackebrandtia sp.]